MPIIQHDGKQYRIIFGSDVSDGHDGVFLELSTLPENRGVLGAYWSDIDGTFTFFAEKVRLPFEVVEAFIEEARERLPADKREVLEPSDEGI